MRDFIETAQTEKDYEILEAKTKEFGEFLIANKSKGYSGIMSVTSSSIDGEVTTIGVTSYVDFIYLILMTVAKASKESGVSMYKIWSDIFSAVKSDLDGSYARRILNRKRGK